MEKKKSNKEQSKSGNTQDVGLDRKDLFPDLDGPESFLVESEWEDYVKKDKRHLDETVSNKLLFQIKEQTVKSKRVQNRVSRRQLMYASAAAILIFFFIGLGFYSRMDSLSPEKEVMDISAYTQVKNTSDVDKTVVLSDGSVVKLAPNSSLRYLTNFTKTHREISLHGKAKFEVSKDPNRPFLVECNDLITEALGTIFTVVESPAGHIEVFLLEGKVKVYVKNDEKLKSILKPGDKLTYQPQQRKWEYQAYRSKLDKEKPSRTENLAKTNETTYYPLYEIEGNELVFKNIELKDVVKALEKIYDCRISYPVSISKNNMYLNIDTSQSVHTVLSNMVLLYDLNLQVKGQNEFILVPKSL